MGSCQSTEAANPVTTTPSRAVKAEPISEGASRDPIKAPPKKESAVKMDGGGRNGKTNGTVEKEIDAPDELPVYPSIDTTDLPVTSEETSGSHGYSSGASTPPESDYLDGSRHRKNSNFNASKLAHSCSALGLDAMIETRREEGDLSSNVVHIEVPFGKPIEEVYDGVHNGPVLGSGISGLVRLATHKATGVKYAVKCLDLGLVESDEGLQQLREEIYIMCQLDHPNIVRLEEVYESHSEIYLVQELCIGGELFDRLDEQPDYHYTEAQCARLVKQMLCAVRYLHSKGIVHRDLKLENFLFSSTSPDSELKMIDFGLSKHFKFGEVHHEAVGTPYTVAPEVIRGTYDERCDIWAIGVITFLLLSGDPPFGGCGGPEPLMVVRSNILKGSFTFEPEETWESVSQQARDFINTLLVINPSQRPTAKEAQRHQWLREWASRAMKGKDNALNPSVVEALVSFKEFSDMRKLLCEVLSFTLLPEQITDLRKEFEKMDTDGSGEISLTALKQVLMQNAGAGSLGALTEEEVEDIFNAMRVRKTETRIHWHEFIAAGLSQCKVDDRNLRLAFDRLDSDHKGYITFENVMDLLGNGASESEEAMRRMWGDSMAACNCSHARITYDDFLLLMKGQTAEPEEESAMLLRPEHSLMGTSFKEGPSQRTLHVLHEDANDALEEEKYVEPEKANVIVLPSGDTVNVSEGGVTQVGAPKGLKRQASPLSLGGRLSEGSPRTSPLSSRRLSTESSRRLSGESSGRNLENSPIPEMPVMGMLSSASFEPNEGPISIDEDEPIMFDEDGGSPEKMPSTNIFMTNSFTPPQSPVRGAKDYITPGGERPVILPKIASESLRGPPLSGPPLTGPPFLGVRRPGPYVRRRSRSVDDQDTEFDDESDTDEKPHFHADSTRAMLLPERNHNVDDVIKDESKTPLVVNRQLYRAHRKMRLAVLEASKRFEEEQTRRASQILQAQENVSGKSRASAGLVMRHGQRADDEAAIRDFLRRNQEEQRTRVEKANKRGGRGRRTRKKTISDMSAMLSSPIPDPQAFDLLNNNASMGSTFPTDITEDLATLTAQAETPVPEPEVDRDRATKKRTTVDPFSQMGLYGEVVKRDSDMTSSERIRRVDEIRKFVDQANEPPSGAAGGGGVGGSEHGSAAGSLTHSSSDGKLKKVLEPQSPIIVKRPVEGMSESALGAPALPL